MSAIHRRVLQDERGMAALIVTFVLIIVVSIIALSFAKVIRREQQQALDRHLSSRAYYAAESGINIAAKAISSSPGAYSATPKTTCGNDAIITANLVLDTATQTQVSCLTVSTAIPQLIYDTVAQGRSQLIPLNAQAGSISRINIYWQNAGGVTNYGGCTAAGGTFRTQPAWPCNAPLLRVDLVQAGAGLSRANMITGAFTGFFSPISGAGSGPVAVNGSTTGNNQGTVRTSNCNTVTTPFDCQATITVPGWTNAYLRIMPLYTNASVAVTAQDSAGGTINLAGTQAIIDSTGRAIDVVRRVQARVPLAANAYAPDFAIIGASGLCKRYAIVPGSSVDVQDISAGTVPATFDHDDPCS